MIKHVVPSKASFLVTRLRQNSFISQVIPIHKNVHGLPALLEVERRYRLFQDYSLSSRLSSLFFMMRRFIVHT